MLSHAVSDKMYTFSFNLKKYDYNLLIPFFKKKYVKYEKNVRIENYLPE